MSNKKSNQKSNEVATTENNNVLNLNAFEALESKPMNELVQLTSELKKLEEGEQLICAVHRETEFLTNEEGKEYECIVCQDKDGNRILLADAVLVSNFKKLFEKEQSINVVYAKIVCKGERKASTSNNKYKDFSIGILKG